MRKTFRFLCITCVLVSVSAFSSARQQYSSPRQKVEVFSGRVIAYTGISSCLNGNSYWSMVIRIEPHKKTPANYVTVDFSLPCEKPLKSVLVNSSIQKFHLIRQRERDSVLEESIDFLQQESAEEKPVLISKIPRWTYLPGNEHFTLPFGKVLPCYYSVELPEVPDM